ncbi:DUF4350 domain-containing protein [soil metagenome]
MTPTPTRVLRRALFWIGAAAFVLVVLLVSVGLAGSGAGGVALSATNAAPGGARAVAEVLKQQGVHVTVADSLDQAGAAIDDPADTTLLIYDADLYLTDDQLVHAVGLAGTVVLVDASFTELRAVAPGVAQAGKVDTTLTADCPLPAVIAAGKVSGGGAGYRVIDENLAATACLGSGDRVYSLVQLPNPAADGTLTLLGTADALSNDKVIENGNAALALNLLGAHHTLVWYLPTAADVPAADAIDLASLTPGWVIPVMVLLVVTFLAAAVWRGRRLGPLVVENLPVTVRASETMLGRARLYGRSSSRLRALDALRIGAIGRLGAACGLPRVADVDEVVAAVASVTGRQAGEVRRLLLDEIPQSDRDLVALSDALLVLERDVARALRL